MLTPLGQDELLDEPARAASKRRSKRSPSDLTVRITSTVFDRHSTFPSSPSLDVIVSTITRAYDARTRWLLAQLTTPDLDRAMSTGSPPPSEPLVHLPRLSSRPPQVEEDDDSANSSQSRDLGSDDDSESDHDGLHVDEAPEELLSPPAPSSLSPTSLAQRAEPPAPTELPPLRVSSPTCLYLGPFRSGISTRSFLVSFPLSAYIPTVNIRPKRTSSDLHSPSGEPRGARCAACREQGQGSDPSGTCPQRTGRAGLRTRGGQPPPPVVRPDSVSDCGLTALRIFNYRRGKARARPTSGSRAFSTCCRSKRTTICAIWRKGPAAKYVYCLRHMPSISHPFLELS